jgi:hypothetical protein
MNIFKKKKAIVCYDLSERPDDMCIGDIIKIYKETGIILVDTFGNGNKDGKMKTNIVQL